MIPAIGLMIGVGFVTIAWVQVASVYKSRWAAPFFAVLGTFALGFLALFMF